MQNSKFWQGLKQAYIRYDRLMEKQGFYVVLGVCILVIVLSAFYTFRLREEGEPPVVSSEEVLTAGGSQEAQSLAQAQALISGQTERLTVPTEAPFTLTEPVHGFTDRTFSDTEPQFFSQSSTWQVHPGIDLLAEYGTTVAAGAAGTVQSVGENSQLGLCVLIDHGNGYQTLYAGLSSAEYVQPGDPVRQGQTIGHVGNGVLAESDAQPHLHFEVRKNGKPVDPLAVFLGIDN